MSDIPVNFIKKKGVTIPFGYKLSTIDGWLEPIESELKILDKYCKEVIKEAYSLRQAAELIATESNRPFSHVALLSQKMFAVLI